MHHQKNIQLFYNVGIQVYKNKLYQSINPIYFRSSFLQLMKRRNRDIKRLISNLSPSQIGSVLTKFLASILATFSRFVLLNDSLLEFHS